MAMFSSLDKTQAPRDKSHSTPGSGPWLLTEEEASLVDMGEFARRAETQVDMEELAGPAGVRRRRWRPECGKAAVVALLIGFLATAFYCGQHSSHFGLSINIDEDSEVFEDGVSSLNMVGSMGWNLMPWDEAYQKARQVAGKLEQTETYALIRGFWANTSSSGSDPIPGYYVGNTDPIRRLGIPALKMQDSHNGFRATDPGELGTTTQWPCVLALASSWDLKLVSKVASAIGREFRGKGANVMLGPAVNVQRTARGGRNFEYLSGEDPYLGARLAEIFVRAVQGEGVMAVVKHFAFNEQETNREHVDSAVDERTAWELYYPPFEAAIKAGAGAMMCAYNKVNGTHACENDRILRHDLKTVMGFQGFVVSDWMATHSTESIERGLDMEMPRGHWYTNDRLAMNTSWVSQVEAATRVLASMYHMRLDEQQGCEPPCHAERKSNQRTTKHVELARVAARDAIVLLKNDGILPISPRKVKTLAVIGWAANQTDVQNPWKGSPYAGGGSAHVVSTNVVTTLDGIKERGTSKGIRVTDCNEGILPPLETAQNADIVVVVATALTAEGWDRRSILLNPKTNALISRVAKLKPTIVLLLTAGAVLTPWREDVSAIANLFHGGEQTGTAWADVLFGDASPVGKLPITFPATLRDTIEPSFGKEAVYIEELFSSYRSQQIKAAFPFGHGLSYTAFKYGKPSLDFTDSCKDVVCIRYEVTNVGDRPGAEVPQAYLHFLELPEKEPQLVLRNFQKTQVLQPGEVHKGRFAFTERDLNIYRVGQGWFRPYGIEVHIGASSTDIRQKINLSSKATHLCWSTVILLVATLLGLRAISLN